MLLIHIITFGCEESLHSDADGVKDGHLINPKVIDARTEISTELLSEQYIFKGVDEDDVRRNF